MSPRTKGASEPSAKHAGTWGSIHWLPLAALGDPGDLLPERGVHGLLCGSSGTNESLTPLLAPTVRTESKGQPCPEAPVRVVPGDTSFLVDVSEEGQRALQGDRPPEAGP